MREIKFRGKDRENWHYGDLVQEIRHNDNKLFDGVITHIKNLEYKNGDYIGDTFPVNSETIGQYTGLHDKNGKEIYEGDILKNKDGLDIVKFHDGCFLVVNEFDEHFENADLLFNYMPVELEVIGNIYDNPELLKGE